MLRLSPFELEAPASLAEVTALLATHGDRARLMAGGTDLMPNLKHEVETPDVVIGLWNVPGLDAIEWRDDHVRLGALVRLATLATDTRLTTEFPALARAAGLVAGPQLREMGTLGGNVCLDTRCVYINQSYFWRSALGYCLKKDGTVCHVVKGGRRCVAAASNDTAPVLIALDARLQLASTAGTRAVPIREFYRTDGEFNQVRRRDEVLSHIEVPRTDAPLHTGYAKLRTRGAIDFPELGVAIAAKLNGDGGIAALEVVVTALAARPLRVPGLGEKFAGARFDDGLIEALGAEVMRRAKPLTNIATDPSYRRRMVPIFVRRAAEDAGLIPKKEVEHG